MTRRQAAVIGTMTSLALVFATLGVTARRAQPAPPDRLPTLWQVPEFSFTDSRGQTFGGADVAGKIWVADFIFTTCSGPCPAMTEQMADLQRAFENEEDVHFVSISVNPETDTPEVLAKYAEAYNADTARWHFLTGPIEDIHRFAVEGFKIGSVDEPVFHSTRFILVDGEGHIRGFYHSAEPDETGKLEDDLRELLSRS